MDLMIHSKSMSSVIRVDVKVDHKFKLIHQRATDMETWHAEYASVIPNSMDRNVKKSNEQQILLKQA